MKKCKFNKNNICSKDEIEIDKITTYDEDNTECMDYDKKILNWYVIYIRIVINKSRFSFEFHKLISRLNLEAGIANTMEIKE